MCQAKEGGGGGMGGGENRGAHRCVPFDHVGAWLCSNCPTVNYLTTQIVGSKGFLIFFLCIPLPVAHFLHSKNDTKQMFVRKS